VVSRSAISTATTALAYRQARDWSLMDFAVSKSPMARASAGETGGFVSSGAVAYSYSTGAAITSNARAMRFCVLLCQPG